MRRNVPAMAAIAAVALLGFSAWFFLRSYSGTPQAIRIGVPPNEQSTLVLIAEEQGFFARNGLLATVKTYETALAAVDGVKKGEVDVAESAEFPIVREALKKENLRVIASIDKFESVHLVGRKDRGIASVSDLKGKKIGAAQGTLTEFYLGRFLDLNGVPLQEVTIVYLPFAESAEALADGRVDAFQVQNKDLPPIRERLERNLVIWPSQSGQAGYEVISGRNDWIASHPETVTRLLKALAQAERFAIEHPAEAMASLQKRLDYDDAYMATLPPQHQYSLTLDQSIILAMEDEARWLIRNGLTEEKTVPDFLDYIYLDGLQAVKPEAVNIIH